MDFCQCILIMGCAFFIYLPHSSSHPPPIAVLGGLRIIATSPGLTIRRIKRIIYTMWGISASGGQMKRDRDEVSTGREKHGDLDDEQLFALPFLGADVSRNPQNVRTPASPIHYGIPDEP